MAHSLMKRSTYFMPIDQSMILQAASLLQAGKLVAIPTETVYGLGADALNTNAIQKIYAAKNRPMTNPLIIHLPNDEAMSDWAIDIPKHAWTLAKKYWPGPLTLILPKHPRVPLSATGNQNSVGLRVPNHPMALALLKVFGGGIAAPSANRYGRISPTTAAHVEEELGSQVDLILDGGPCQVGIESTIISMLGEEPIVLRQGSLSAVEIADTLGLPSISYRTSSATQVPGQSESHYAPSKSLYLVEQIRFLDAVQQLEKRGDKFSVLSFGVKPKAFLSQHLWISASNDPASYAHHLYAYLRLLDHSPGDFILVEAPPTDIAWAAVIDRLRRASCQASPLF